jgi:hypothetical protein
VQHKGGRNAGETSTCRDGMMAQATIPSDAAFFIVILGIANLSS